MRTKVTLVLLFLNVALFFFIFKFERSWRTERASLEARSQVFGSEVADIRALTVTSAVPGGSYGLARRGDGWFVTAPLDWPANPHAVSRIVNELQFLKHDASFTVSNLKNNGQSLADFGLDQPRLTVAFTSGDSAAGTAPRTTTFYLGDTSKIGNRLYLLSGDGETIHVVPRGLADSLTLPLDQLRTDDILDIPVFEARALSIQKSTATGNARVALHRDGAHWTFDTPIIARASKDATALMLSALGALRTKTFITANPPAALPSAAPALRLTIEGNNRRETLLLGETVPLDDTKPKIQISRSADNPASTDYYAQLEGRPALFTVTVSDALHADLLGAQEKLRETRVLDFDARSVTAITLTAPNQPPLTLQRDLVANSPDSAAWQLLRRGENSQPPQTLPADRAAVQRLIEQLSLLTAQKFSSDAPSAADLENWGFNRPEREVTLTLAVPAAPGHPASAATSQLTLQLGLATQRDNFAYARLAGTASVYVYAVSPDILRETPVAAREWRERLVRELPAAARLTTLKLTDLAENKLILDLTLDPSAKVQEPVPVILASLRMLRAKKFSQDNFTDKVFLGGEDRAWRYRLEAGIALPGGAAGEQTTTTTLLFSERIGGTQQLAGSAELNTVFEIEQPLVDALWALTYGPRDPGPVTKP